MTNITLKQLRYFQALGQNGHFGRAADACSISQPALSMQIKELEKQLGMSLIERDVRQIRMTSFGRAFFERAQSILRSVDELSEFARASQSQLNGLVKMGIIPTIAPYLLPKFMKEHQISYPELTIHVRETLTSKLIDELSDGRLDCAIVALPVSVNAFEEVALFDESFFLVRPQSEAGQPVLSHQIFNSERLLLLEEGHCFRDQALSFCNIDPRVQKLGLDGSSLSTLVQMVSANMGMTFLPKMAVALETRQAQVCISQFPDPEPSRTIGMIWRKTSPLSDYFMKIAETVRKVAQV